jgi:hypothetical protein
MRLLFFAIIFFIALPVCAQTIPTTSITTTAEGMVLMSWEHIGCQPNDFVYIVDMAEVRDPAQCHYSPRKRGTLSVDGRLFTGICDWYDRFGTLRIACKVKAHRKSDGKDTVWSNEVIYNAIAK